MSTPELLNSISQNLLDAYPDGVVVCDTAGRITEWNPAATQILGWSRDQSLGRSPSEFLILPTDRNRFDRWFRILISRETPGRNISPGIIALLRGGGDSITVQVSCSRLLIGDEIHPVAFIRRLDSTSPSGSLLAPELNRSTDPEHSFTASETRNVDHNASMARNEFLANVTHELRTPMNAILGMTELALHEELPDVVRDYLLTAKDSADTMLSLINDILDYSRLDVGRDQLDVVPFDVRRLLEETMRGSSLRAHERGLELAAAVDPDVPFRVYGDPARLRQLLTNLISNAIKFTERGEVVVGIKLVAPDSELHDSAEWKAGDPALLHFSVKDTGIGIDQPDHDHIFSPFVQVDSSMTRSYPGTGLGLSICSELARLMGGRIWVESELGRGSTFHFTASLSVAPASDDQPLFSDLQPDQLAGTRVLIVDDNESTRRILKEMVEAWEMHASIADSVESARRQMQAASAAGKEFQLLIIDALMPTKDGIEFLRELDSAKDDTGASILMMSRADQRLFRKRIAGLHVDAFLEKPVSQSGLLSSIAEAFEEVANDRLRGQTIEQSAQSLRVLVAEDIPANQKVVTAILSRRGHEPTIACNGREAIDLFERGRFDVILMDVQMPILDGIQATKAIRELEKISGKRVPVVAMTAHAMPGDRDLCLAAGMDGYLAKPLDAQLLLKTIEQLNQPKAASKELLTSFISKSGFWRLRQEKPGSKTSPLNGELRSSETTPHRKSWNPAVALRRMGGDTELLSSMVDYFLEDSPPLLQELRQLIDAGDAVEACRVAHSLKGLCSNFEADAATQAGASIEAACNAGKLEDASTLMSSLSDELDQLSPALTAWQKANLPTP